MSNLRTIYHLSNLSPCGAGKEELENNQIYLQHKLGVIRNGYGPRRKSRLHGDPYRGVVDDS